MRKKGFTLVELMIVIAIIAILASIIMPKMGNSRTKAQLTACKGNLKHLSIALEMYSNDNRGAYTPGSPTTWNYPTYLVNGGYLKTEPLCPLGNRYYIRQDYPAWRQHTAGTLLVLCYSNASGGVAHPNTPINCPYLSNNQVFDN